MQTVDFVVIGSGGGGGTLSWMLAKAGFEVVVLEQGADHLQVARDSATDFNKSFHDEYRFRLERPDPKRKPRGDYNTFRESSKDKSKLLTKLGGWTGTALGGGSLLWGAWAIRALPVDFKLGTLFSTLDPTLNKEGYLITDWPIDYSEMEPFYNVAETLFGVCGDRDLLNKSIEESTWFKEFESMNIKDYGNWFTNFPFPSKTYPTNPASEIFNWTASNANPKCHPIPLPTALISPGTAHYNTQKQLEATLTYWKERGDFWKTDPQNLWSSRVRQACNMCGFCGEYVCWGSASPKSGTASTTLLEISDMKNARVVTNAKVFEITYDQRLKRATGVRYLDTTDPDNPVEKNLRAKHVVVSCGAIQSARLLLMSGSPSGLGNRFGNLGRYATFHLFGLGARCVLPEKFQGYLHSEFGHTGSSTLYDFYFLRENDSSKWFKGGIVTGIAKKNPLENADSLVVRKNLLQDELFKNMENYTRTIEARFTGDDFPHFDTVVDLDPNYVDEYGFPVARITRSFREYEKQMFRVAGQKMRQVFAPLEKVGVNTSDKNQFAATDAEIDLFGDHQMGTCRMGDDPRNSVVDRYCRLHEVPNVFVVDTSFMPTGLGVNPMMTVIANALRVGSWIVEQKRKGQGLS